MAKCGIAPKRTGQNTGATGRVGEWGAPTAAGFARPIPQRSGLQANSRALHLRSLHTRI